MSAPTKEEIAALASLCSKREWENRLLCSHRFIAAVSHSLEDAERVASQLLGRRISVNQPSLKNLSDSEL